MTIPSLFLAAAFTVTTGGGFMIKATESDSDTAACNISIMASHTATANFLNDYLRKPIHRAFAISATGSWAYRSDYLSAARAAQAALLACQAQNRKYEPEAPCRVVHIDQDWAPECRNFLIPHH